MTPSPKSLRNLELRARILQGIRAFFAGRGFLEVETPHRIPANAPEPHIDAVPSGDWYLHTSPELAMKRLLGAGCPRIFQVCRCWREGERGKRHLPEFTMLEWYRAGEDYRALMEDCEGLLPALGFSDGGERPWSRVTVTEAFGRWAGTTPEEALEAGTFDELVALRVEPGLAGLGTPVFLVDYPSACASLARRKPGRPGLAERFELYAGGLELANGFSELTDPVEQRTRFEADRESRREAGRDPYPMPEPFLRGLARVPPSAGIALGVDRLVMLLVGADTIDEVVALVPEEL
ncbi:MAG: EF-P lysine aminoacylase EpmA [Deferrisomatales bacterium]|nr:EF-P lysine aminoacylase EpmA [Deferrisomatales bacterium]